MKDTPLLALVEREGYLWSSELTSNGQKTLSTGAALLFQDNHVRNGVSLEKLPDAFGNFLKATFGPDMIDFNGAYHPALEKLRIRRNDSSSRRSSSSHTCALVPLRRPSGSLWVLI
jgi:hypothetical protein